MFIAFFNASSIQGFYNAIMFTSYSLASACAGALLSLSTGGASKLVAGPVSVASINAAAVSLVVE